MNTKLLKQKILDLAIRGKLVPQDPNDEPASVLLERIRAEKDRLVAEGKIKRSKSTTDNRHYENVPFDVPSGWEWCKVEDIFDLNPKNNLDDETVVGFIPMELVSAGFGYSHSFEERKWGDVKKGYCHFQNGDIGIAKISPCFENRKSTIFYDLPNDVGAGTTELVILRGHCVCTEFYLYLFQSSWYIGEGTKYFKGNVGQQRVKKDIFTILQIPLPPLAEQKRIVAELRQWFAIAECLEKKYTELQEAILKTKSKVLNLAIHGKLVPQDPSDEPATELLNRIALNVKPCDTSQYPNLPFVLPSNWVWVKHNEIIDLVGGSQPPKNKFVPTPQKGYIRLYQIRDYGTSPVPVYIPLELAQKRTKKGDILLARYGGSLGKVFRAEDGAYNVAMAKVVIKYDRIIDIDFAHLYYKASLYQGKLKSISRTAQVGFNENDFIDLFFPIPPFNEQKRISKKVSEIFNILDTITTEL